MTDHIDQAEHGGDSLRDDGGQCRSADSHTQHKDREEIQGNVHKGGKQQKVDRSFAVAQASDNACKHIVKVCDRNPQENHKNVIISAMNDVFRCVHPLQDAHTQEANNGGHDCRKHCGQPSGVRYKLAHAVIISGTEFLGDRNCKSAAGTGAEADDHKVDGSRGADCRQRGHAQAFADNDGIHHVVKLLKEESKKHWNRKT